MNKDKIVRNSIIGIFVALYFCVSIISTIHVVDFFALTNPYWLAVSLAVAFEIGAAASLAAIIILDKTSRSLVWFLFILLTGMQAMGNMYFAYDHAHDYQSWMELFSLNEEEPIFQKRVLAIISGAILPLVALGFIKSLVDYVRPSENNLKIESKGNVSLAVSEPKEKLEVKTVVNEIIPVQPMPAPDGTGIKASMDVIDEDELLKESVTKSEPVNLESVKNVKMVDTIKEVKELIIEDEKEQKDTGHIDAKAEAIKQVLEDNSGERQVENSSKWPGQNITKDDITKDSNRNFGPPDINSHQL